jgi:uncharacterized protein
MKPRLIVFAKAPVAGRAKTRLIPVLGPTRAAQLAASMLQHTLSTARAALQESVIGSIELCVSPNPMHPDWAPWRNSEYLWTTQCEGDLGSRMLLAVEHAQEPNAQPCLLVGTDCPDLGVAHLAMAAAALATHDVAMLPAADGGYVLLAMRKPEARLFDNMRWSTSDVANETRRRCAHGELSLWTGPILCDIDDPADLAHPWAMTHLGGAL